VPIEADEPTIHGTEGHFSPMPSLYLPHGGGPCFFMDWQQEPKDMWDAMAAWLRSIGTTLPRTPTALLVISAHLEAPVATVTSAASPALIYDY
jgi:aromatic ring-opening dioxygenase catalytic subunit (LigB family)